MGEYEAVWKEFESNEITHSAAHYLLAIASFFKTNKKPRAVDLSRMLKVSRSAVSTQLKTLCEHQLVLLNGAHEIEFTRRGRQLVSKIAEKRKVFQNFLEEVLHVPSSTAKRDGCMVEHLISEETASAMFQYLQAYREKQGQILGIRKATKKGPLKNSQRHSNA